MSRNVWLSVVTAAAIAGGGTAYYRLNASNDRPQLTTAAVTRGSVVETVEATGTLSPVDTVEIGSQVTGSVKSLGADFNSEVKEGQIVATLDPASLQAQVDQASATVARLEADLTRARVTLADAQTKLNRAEQLASQQLISAADLDAARSTRDGAKAAIASSQAQVVQARAALQQAKVNLAHTIIRAPVDGVVLSRNVEIGQTVTSGLQTPTLFVIAKDLNKMRVQASVDEADIGRVKVGQPVQFTVDAYGNEAFHGVVSQVRLQPTVAQNVVSYTTMIDVENDQEKLKPGMTATVKIETGRSDDSLVVPAAALRFTPSRDVLQAMGGADQASGARPRTAGDASQRTGARPQAAADRDRSSGRPGADGTRPGVRPSAVWILQDGRLQRVGAQVTHSDGTRAAVISPKLTEGASVVIGVAAPQTATSSPSPQGGSPLVPTRQRGQGGGRRGGF